MNATAVPAASSDRLGEELFREGERTRLLPVVMLTSSRGGAR
jgi:hypothetical protein